MSPSSRSRISLAARLVKVTARICFAATPWFVTRCATRCVSVRVLPVPGPAMMSNGPSAISAAAHCSESRPARGSEESGKETVGASCNEREGKVEQAACLSFSGVCSSADDLNRLDACPTLADWTPASRSEEHTSELQSQSNLVCRLLLEKKKHRPRTVTSSQ